jgi:hypothetical protein
MRVIDHVPSAESTMPSNTDDAALYGYEDPDEVHHQRKQQEHHIHQALYGDESGRMRQPRRSSMKHEEKDANSTRPRRRASIHAGVAIIEVRLPGQSQPVLRRSSIDFMEHPTAVPPASNDNTATWVGERWMSPEEYDKIAHDNQKIVRALEKGTDKNFCTRGLEDQLDPHGIERIRKEAKQTVWEEQQRQKMAGIFDENQIMENYRMAAVQAKFEAADRAQQDSADIETYVKKTREMIRRMSC